MKANTEEKGQFTQIANRLYLDALLQWMDLTSASAF